MSADITFVKYCPVCGKENPLQQPFCLHCPDGDLTSVLPEPRRQEHDITVSSDISTISEDTSIGTRRVNIDNSISDVCVLELISDPNVSFFISDGQTVGRTKESDVVLSNIPDLDAISRRHARFFKHNDQWYVQHIGVTNFIKVDGDTYKDSDEVAIYDGNILVLSLTAFIVRLNGG